MSFWRKDPPVVEVVNGMPVVKVGGMLPAQRTWWEMTNFIRAFTGGYGAGKTSLLSKWGIATALHNAPVWTMLVAPTFPAARRTLIPTLEYLLEGKCAARPDMKYRHLKSEHQFVIDVECRPTATILYQSGDEPRALKGPNLGCVGLDEPYLMDKEVFEVSVSRCRDPRARLHALGLTGTPEQLNWGYDLIEGELREKYDVGHVRASTKENVTLRPDYAERLERGYDEKAVEAYVHGKFVNLCTGRVFYGFDRELNVKKLKREGSALGCGMDFNVDPMAFCVGWHDRKSMHVCYEYELPNSDTELACATLKSNHQELRLVYPDPTCRKRATNAPGGITDYRIIQRSGLIPMAPEDPWPRRDSINAVNALFSQGLLTVDPSCKKLIKYLTEHTWEQAHKQKEMTHLLDALRYMVTYLFPIHRPDFKVGKVAA